MATYVGTNKKDKIKGSNNRDYIYGYDENDKLYGEGGNDYLYGGYGNDKLDGGHDNDVLFGGYGSDELKGGKGADTFAFRNRYEGIDTIKDFKWKDGDKIQISRFGFGATSTSQFHYNSHSGALSFGNTQFATLKEHTDFNVHRDIKFV